MQRLTVAEAREIDRRAQEELGLPGVVLMENAGAELVRLILAEEGAALETARQAGRAVAVLCGGGNNGGDGWVIARRLHNAGVPVRVLTAAAPERLPPDARTHRDVVARMGLPVEPASPEALAGAPLIVDALLGTGARGALRAPLAELLRAANRAPARRVAVDVPSGLDADSGAADPNAFQAHRTGTFLGEKRGFEGARRWTGRVHVLPIGVPPELVRAVCRKG